MKINTHTEFPPGLFNKSHNYACRRWRQAQFLADVFWSRWRRQYLPLLLARQKWPIAQRSVAINDFVLVVDQLLPRNLWCVGRVISVKPDHRGHVRSASVKVSKHKLGKDLKFCETVLDRPITKLILLRQCEDL